MVRLQVYLQPFFNNVSSLRGTKQSHMKNLLIFCLLLPLQLQAQQIQYASKVVKYSSDLGGKLNSVKRILGKPDVFPQGGPSPNAWVSKDALGSAFVEVEFEKAQTVKQIAIFENHNAGNVTKVLVADATGKFRKVIKKQSGFARWINKWQSGANPDRAFYFNRKRRKIEKAVDVSHNADIDYVMLETPEENVKMVRVEFNFSLKPGQKQIDAIAISDSEEPIQPQINLLDGAENFGNAENLIYSPNKEYDLSSILVYDNELYYTISMYEKAGEIHAIDLVNPKEIVDVTKKIRNDKKLNYILGFSPETKTMLMGSENKWRRGGEDLGFDFFNLENGVFTYKKPLRVLGYNNYGDYADVFLAKDNKHILFGIESDLTQGGYDLYFSQPKDEDTFGLLQNMGKTLNTAGDETNPFLLSDNKTLIFTSNGYSGYGDFDLYVSTRLDDTWKNWSEPKNLGPKVNGESFDTNPFYDEKTETLYYVSFRDGVSGINKIKIPISSLVNLKF
jgi:hypothetical protein